MPSRSAFASSASSSTSPVGRATEGSDAWSSPPVPGASATRHPRCSPRSRAFTGCSITPGSLASSRPTPPASRSRATPWSTSRRSASLRWGPATSSIPEALRRSRSRCWSSSRRLIAWSTRRPEAPCAWGPSSRRTCCSPRRESRGSSGGGIRGRVPLEGGSSRTPRPATSRRRPCSGSRPSPARTWLPPRGSFTRFVDSAISRRRSRKPSPMRRRPTAASAPRSSSRCCRMRTRRARKSGCSRAISRTSRRPSRSSALAQICRCSRVT
jgi:hypothetical protein